MKLKFCARAQGPPKIRFCNLPQTVPLRSDAVALHSNGTVYGKLQGGNQPHTAVLKFGSQETAPTAQIETM